VNEDGSTTSRRFDSSWYMSVMGSCVFEITILCNRSLKALRYMVKASFPGHNGEHRTLHR